MKKVFALSCIVALLAGCGSADEEKDVQSVASSGDVTFTDMWTKATDSEMTGSFGVITNDSDEPIHITGVAVDVAGMSQLHETVTVDGVTQMQEMADGFVIEPGEDYVLEPGGHHLMFMDLTEELVAGDVLTVTLEQESGEDLTFESEIRTFTGAQEEYGVHGEDGDHGDHENDQDEQSEDEGQ